MEYLTGAVAVRTGNGAFISWRCSPRTMQKPVSTCTRTTDGKRQSSTAPYSPRARDYTDATADFTKTNTYFVKKVWKRRRGGDQGSYTMPRNKAAGAYITVPTDSGHGAFRMGGRPERRRLLRLCAGPPRGQPSKLEGTNTGSTYGRWTSARTARTRTTSPGSLDDRRRHVGRSDGLRYRRRRYAEVLYASRTA